MSIDWGSVPDWLAGAGAVAALIFARAAARSARDTAAAQQLEIARLQHEERSRADDHRRRQAHEVALWVTIHREQTETFDDDTESFAVGARISNASNLPIYQLLAMGSARGEIFSSRYSVIGPMTNRRHLDRLTESLGRATEGLPLRELLLTDELRVACSFRDALGNWWCRSATGELLEATDQDDAETKCHAAI